VATDSRSGYSLVLTAAHCAYDESGKAFATNWLFIPEYDSAPTSNCANTRYGCWTAQALVVHNGYAGAGGFNSTATTYDFAFAVVAAGGKSVGQLDATVGSFAVSTSSLAVGTRVYAFGYPAAGKYNGTDLTYCSGPVFEDPYNARKTWGLKCDMTGGSSGGPWLSNFTESSGTGTLRSLNSYRYNGINAIHGPKFNTNTQAVYNAANGATTNTIVQ
jgi:V8-like Glu-specific endopeptidase